MSSEFEQIKHLKKHFNLSNVGDDCAVFPKDDYFDYLITSDMLVEDIDFKLEWTTPKHIGYKALAVSLSDIAAMGGTPLYSSFSIGLSKELWHSGFLESFYKGVFANSRSISRWPETKAQDGVIEILGGDISKTDGPLTIDSTMTSTILWPSPVARTRQSKRTGAPSPRMKWLKTMTSP